MPTRKWGSEQLVNTIISGAQVRSDVAALAGGGFVVVWEDWSSGDPVIRAQRYDAVGNKAGAELLIYAASGLGQIQPAVTGLADGGFFVSWGTQRSPTDYDITGLVYNSDGNVVRWQEPVPFNIFNPDTRNQFDVDVAQLGSGSVAVWMTHEATETNVMMRIFDQAGNPGGEIRVNPPLRNPVRRRPPGTLSLASTRAWMGSICRP